MSAVDRVNKSSWIRTVAEATALELNDRVLPPKYRAFCGHTRDDCRFGRVTVLRCEFDEGMSSSPERYKMVLLRFWSDFLLVEASWPNEETGGVTSEVFRTVYLEPGAMDKVFDYLGDLLG